MFSEVSNSDVSMIVFAVESVLFLIANKHISIRNSVKAKLQRPKSSFFGRNDALFVFQYNGFETAQAHFSIFFSFLFFFPLLLSQVNVFRVCLMRKETEFDRCLMFDTRVN